MPPQITELAEAKGEYVMDINGAIEKAVDALTAARANCMNKSSEKLAMILTYLATTGLEDNIKEIELTWDIINDGDLILPKFRIRRK